MASGGRQSEAEYTQTQGRQRFFVIDQIHRYLEDDSSQTRNSLGRRDLEKLRFSDLDKLVLLTKTDGEKSLTNTKTTTF